MQLKIYGNSPGPASDHQFSKRTLLSSVSYMLAQTVCSINICHWNINIKYFWDCLYPYLCSTSLHLALLTCSMLKWARSHTNKTSQLWLKAAAALILFERLPLQQFNPEVFIFNPGLPLVLKDCLYISNEGFFVIVLHNQINKSSVGEGLPWSEHREVASTCNYATQQNVVFFCKITAADYASTPFSSNHPGR